MTDNLQHALEYAALGLHVFPIYEIRADGRCACGKDCGRDAGKHPRYHEDDLTSGLHSATTDEEQIRAWWGRWPRASIGIATGPSGLAVIDVDPHKGGRDTRAILQRQYAPLPTTWQVVTGSGGDHFLFAAPAGGIKSTVEELGPGLDTKGRGGYIVADRPLAPLPPWLVPLIEPAPVKTQRPTPSRDEAPDYELVRSALHAIPPQTDYDGVYLRAVMGVHAAFPDETGIALVEGWSPHKPGEVAKKFRSFKRDSGVGVGTLFYLAEQYGWKRPEPATFTDRHGRTSAATPTGQDARPEASGSTPTPISAAPSFDPLARIAELERQVAERDTRITDLEWTVAQRDEQLATCGRRADQLQRERDRFERLLDHQDGAVLRGMVREIAEASRHGHHLTDDEGRRHVRLFKGSAAKKAKRATSTVSRKVKQLAEAGTVELLPNPQRFTVTCRDGWSIEKEEEIAYLHFPGVDQGDEDRMLDYLLGAPLGEKQKHGGPREAKPRRICPHCGEEHGTYTAGERRERDRCQGCHEQVGPDRITPLPTIYRDATGERIPRPAPLHDATLSTTEEGLHDATPPPVEPVPQKPRGLCQSHGCEEAASVGRWCPRHHPSRWGDYARDRQWAPAAIAGD